MRKFFYTALMICPFFLYSQEEEPVQLEVDDERVIKVAFGSCNKSDLPQPIWNAVLKSAPDVFIWTGDNIYADSRNMNDFVKKYDAQLNNEGYRRVKDSIQVIGTWNDHDYGENDAGKEFPKKKESRDLALEFLGVEKSHPVWQREGMYQSYMLGDQDIKVIILDTRYFRDPLSRKGNAILPNEKGDILGEEQWAWLDHQLRHDEGQLMTLIISSIQVIPEEHPYEKWANFPSTRSRLFELLHSADAKNVVFLSGDRHMGEISILEYKGKNYYEVTSSGLTHVWEDLPEEANKHRRGQVVKQLNFGFIGIVKNDRGRNQYVLQLKGQDNRILQSLEIYLDQ